MNFIQYAYASQTLELLLEYISGFVISTGCSEMYLVGHTLGVGSYFKALYLKLYDLSCGPTCLMV